ncbi:MAG: GNAT family N-acetyltransferase [Saprospiraceae bacterium]|nr:GNAT family N-acetyltransferase [Saprospiraceae bacterium]
MIQTSITTDRLQLELLHPNDHEFMRVLVNTAGWIEFIGDRNVHTQEDAMAYVDRIINTPNLYYWVARLKAANTPVGVISFLKRDYLEHFDIGFALLPDFQGSGYAYEGAKGVLDMVKAYPEYQTVLATTIPHNVHSISLLTRLGLRFEGEIKPGEETLHVYST